MRSNEYQLLLARLLVFSSINLMRLSAGLVQTFIYPMINATKYGRAEKQRRKTQQEAGKTNFTAVFDEGKVWLRRVRLFMPVAKNLNIHFNTSLPSK